MSSPLYSDTDPAVERLQLAIMARLPAWRKVALIAGMNRLLSGLAVAGLRQGEPVARDGDVWRGLDERRVGAEAARLFALARASRGVTPEVDAYVTGDPVPTTLAVIAALDRLGVPYYIDGSLASGIHGAYRATTHPNVVADLREDQVSGLADLLGPGFYADADAMRDAIQTRSSFNVLDLHTGFKVDVFIPKGRPFDRAQFARRILEPLVPSGEHSAYVASVEDTVLAKLERYRAGSEVSDRQWTDILGMLKVRAPDVDRAYLKLWAVQLGLADLLDRALAEAGPAQPRVPSCLS